MMSNLISMVAVAGAALAGAAAWQGSGDGQCAAVQQASYVQKDKDIVDTAVAAGSFKTLAAALAAADLVETLKGAGPFTVFAPTDEAFAKLPAGTVEMLLKPENKEKLRAVLTYHVAPGRLPASEVVKLSGAATVNGQRVDIKAAGGSVMLDQAKVLKTDIAASNGIIHVIDSVIMPEMRDAVEVASAAGSFSTLLTAAKAAGLVEALRQGPITIFAPTDEAFAKLPAGTVEDLLKPENKGKLASILKYHVVQGRVDSEKAASAGKAATLEGSSVSIRKGSGGLMIDKARVVTADVDASNGVIHIVDTVLMPSAE